MYAESLYWWCQDRDPSSPSFSSFLAMARCAVILYMATAWRAELKRNCLGGVSNCLNDFLNPSRWIVSSTWFRLCSCAVSSDTVCLGKLWNCVHIYLAASGAKHWPKIHSTEHNFRHNLLECTALQFNWSQGIETEREIPCGDQAKATKSCSLGTCVIFSIVDYEDL